MPEAADALVALCALSRGGEAKASDRSLRLLLAGQPHAIHFQADTEAFINGNGYGYGDGDGDGYGGR